MEDLSPVLAKRLKELRESRGLTLAGLSKALTEKYGIQISKESLTNYEVVDSFHSKARKNEGMSVKYLRCLADFYDVSTDYLLGLIDPDNSTADEKLRMVSEYTGLSNKAIQNLRDFMSSIYHHTCKKWCDNLLASDNIVALSLGLASYEVAFARSTAETWKREKEDEEAAKQGKPVIRFSLGLPSFNDAKYAAGWRLSEIVHRMTEDLEKNFSVNDEAFIGACIDLIKDETECKDFFEYAKSRNEK